MELTFHPKKENNKAIKHSVPLSMSSLDSLPSLIKYEICSFLRGGDILSLSIVNKKFYNFIANNLHSLPKKPTKLHISRSKKGIQVMIGIEQRRFNCYYGVQLKQFRKRENNPYKKEDDFDGNDLNAISMENQFDMSTRWVSNVDSSLSDILHSICRKVNFKYLSLADPSREDLELMSDCCRLNRSIVRDITIFFRNEEYGEEMVTLLNSIQQCREVKIHCSKGVHLPSGILSSKSIRNASIVDIDMEDWTARATTSRDEDSDSDDNLICRMKGESIRLRGTRLTEKGANRLLKEWCSGVRHISGHPGVEISTDISSFKESTVFSQISDYRKDESNHNCYSITRSINNRLFTAHVSWFADCFSIYVAGVHTPHDDFWFA